MAEAITTSRFEYDPESEEPYIVLPGLPELRLTPLRKGDVEAQVRMYSDPSVGGWALRRPFPYTEVDAAWWIDHVLASHATQLGPLVEAIQSGAGEGPFYTQPLALRYHPNPMSGSETGVKDKKGLPPLSTLGLSAGDYVGNLHFWPNTPIDEGEPAMIDRPREEQVWVAAWDVLPLLQGRGVGRTMLNAGLEAWIGWMGVGKVLAMAQKENVASCGLAKKCGFTEIKRAMQVWPEEKGGGEREIIWWEWTPGRSATDGATRDDITSS